MKPLRLLTAILCISMSSHAFAEVQDIDKELSDLTERLAVPIKDHGKTKVAVIDFTNLDGSSAGELGKYIAEQLTVDFVMGKRAFSVLDRANLRNILAEHKLTSQGLVDPDNAKKLGQFAGVDALILGTIIPKGTNSVSLTAKIITTDTAEIIGAARAEFKADAAVQQLVSKPVTGSNAGSASGPLQDDKTEVAKKFGDLRVELQPLRIVNGQVFLVSMTLVNQNPSKSIWVALDADKTGVLKSVITDSNGTQYQSWGGSEATGIEISFFNKNSYDRDNFSPATEIKPNDSVSATVSFQTMYSRPPPQPGACNIQLQLLLGHDLRSNRSTVSVENLTSKLSAN
jgi:hypothetical protein